MRPPLLNEELLQLGKWMAKLYVAPLISCYQAMLPRPLKPKSSAGKSAMEEWACFVRMQDGLTSRQREVLEAIKQRQRMKGERISQSIWERGQEADRYGLRAYRETAKDSAVSAWSGGCSLTDALRTAAACPGCAAADGAS